MPPKLGGRMERRSKRLARNRREPESREERGGAERHERRFRSALLLHASERRAHEPRSPLGPAGLARNHDAANQRALAVAFQTDAANDSTGRDRHQELHGRIRRCRNRKVGRPQQSLDVTPLTVPFESNHRVLVENAFGRPARRFIEKDATAAAR